MYKKSQVSQLFFYLLALFIIGATLIIGVKYIVKIRGQVQNIDLVEFKTSLEDDAEMLSTKYGSWREKSYFVPQGVKQVCFFEIDSNLQKKVCTPQPIEPLDYVMCDAWQTGAQNVMTIPFVLETPINLTNIKIKDEKGFKCFNVVDNKITVVMTGLGNGVQISEP